MFGLTSKEKIEKYLNVIFDVRDDSINDPDLYEQKFKQAFRDISNLLKADKYATRSEIQISGGNQAKINNRLLRYLYVQNSEHFTTFLEFICRGLVHGNPYVRIPAKEILVNQVLNVMLDEPFDYANANASNLLTTFNHWLLTYPSDKETKDIFSNVVNRNLYSGNCSDIFNKMRRCLDEKHLSEFYELVFKTALKNKDYDLLNEIISRHKDILPKDYKAFISSRIYHVGDLKLLEFAIKIQNKYWVEIILDTALKDNNLKVNYQTSAGVSIAQFAQDIANSYIHDIDLVEKYSLACEIQKLVNQAIEWADRINHLKEKAVIDTYLDIVLNNDSQTNNFYLNYNEPFLEARTNLNELMNNKKYKTWGEHPLRFSSDLLSLNRLLRFLYVQDSEHFKNLLEFSCLDYDSRHLLERKHAIKILNNQLLNVILTSPIQTTSQNFKTLLEKYHEWDSKILNNKMQVILAEQIYGYLNSQNVDTYFDRITKVFDDKGKPDYYLKEIFNLALKYKNLDLLNTIIKNRKDIVFVDGIPQGLNNVTQIFDLKLLEFAIILQNKAWVEVILEKARENESNEINYVTKQGVTIANLAQDICLSHFDDSSINDKYTLALEIQGLVTQSIVGVKRPGNTTVQVTPLTSEQDNVLNSFNNGLHRFSPSLNNKIFARDLFKQLVTINEFDLHEFLSKFNDFNFVLHINSQRTVLHAMLEAELRLGTNISVETYHLVLNKLKEGSIEDFNPENKDKITPLQLAVRTGNLALVRALLDKIEKIIPKPSADELHGSYKVVDPKGLIGLALSLQRQDIAKLLVDRVGYPSNFSLRPN